MNRLLTRMVLFFSCLIIVAVAVLGITIYRSSMSLVENSLGAQAQIVAESAASLIDKERYAELSVEAGETPYYQELRAKMNALREINGLKYLYTLAQGEENGEAYYYYMVDGAPEDVAEDDFSPIGTREEIGYGGMIQAFAEGKTVVGELTNDSEYGAAITAYVPLRDNSGKLMGIMGADFDATNVYALMSNNTRMTLWVALGIILAGIALVVALASYLTRPLNQLTNQVAKVREGDMTVDIAIHRKDEIGILAHTFQQLVTNTRSVIRSMKDNSERLLSASEDVSQHARSTTEASRHIAVSIEEASGGAHTQVNRATDMTKAVEGMTRSMLRITESASIVSDVAQETKEHSDRGNALIGQAMMEMETIGEAAEAMLAATKELESRSDEIGEITTIMSDIADQTNLLALNAAIEAAHAGENGRGFAVVAEQVRKLAAQSQSFAVQIAELISKTQEQTARLSAGMEGNADKVQAGLVSVREAGMTFNSIAQGLEQVHEQLVEVSSASQEVSAESEEVAASVEEMEQISRRAAQHFQGIVSNSNTQIASMDEVTASAESLKAMSNELTSLNKRFIV
ncbi:methyl-accepting chemotaxis protein [Paenibacillus paeoniae]|uniref:Methyl-accepting chemotaxis protein n=1 Tax=Paenibacillus paeoniae TaxID=2292705 RepID=A0A371PH49_9BACL|nr:HAMP domain-containing methyl-accepting chemotaxis protein [Paenibacillus paeoniae]REK74710.1 methyl-accepting chemotaxis protein [Paenibacillus paeoniae]